VTGGDKPPELQHGEMNLKKITCNKRVRLEFIWLRREISGRFPSNFRVVERLDIF
jgi:hypothetical protein